MTEWITKQDLYIYCLQKTNFRSKDTHRLKVKVWTRYLMKVETNKQKTWGSGTYTRCKVHFKTKAITRDKEEPSNSTSGYLFGESQNTN